MKYTFTILIFIILKVNGYGYSRHYLIYEKDTIELSDGNPLYKYFETVGTKEIPGLYDRSDESPQPIKRYSCIWELKRDSLFLNKVILEPHTDYKRDLDLKIMFGKDIVFSDWYSGTLSIPRGKYINDPEMGNYGGVYESTERITFSNGKIIEKTLFSNKEYIIHIKNEHKLRENITNIKDTFLFHLNKLDWKSLNDTNNTFWCDDTFLLSYDIKGDFKDMKLFTYNTDSTTFKEKLFDYRLNRYSKRKMKKTFEGLCLDYINPHRAFIIYIDLRYMGTLEIRDCNINYYVFPGEDETDKHVNRWIKKQN